MGLVCSTPCGPMLSSLTRKPLCRKGRQFASLVRLNKRLRDLDVCSRREADELISQGQVLVNGVVCDALGSKVPLTARIEVSRPAAAPRKLTIALHKPRSFISQVFGAPLVILYLSPWQTPHDIFISAFRPPLPRLHMRAEASDSHGPY